jgi:hypothetical protein
MIIEIELNQKIISVNISENNGKHRPMIQMMSHSHLSKSEKDKCKEIALKRYYKLINN